MMKQTYDEQGIKDYLLDASPAGESERRDELSFTDDEFAMALQVAEKDLVDAYVEGELSGAALEQFKAHYLASPLRRRNVSFARAFRAFTGKRTVNQASARQNAKAEKPAGVRRFFSRVRFTSMRPALQWSFAVAILILLVSGGWLVFENGRLRQQMSQAQARRDETLRHEQELQKEFDEQRAKNEKTEQELARLREERSRLDETLRKEQQSPSVPSVVSLILFPPMRGVAKIPTVSVPASAGSIATQLELEANDYAGYRVALIDPANNQNLWRSASLRAKARGNGSVLSISFPTTLLKARTYTLRVTGVTATGASEIISDYPFKVVK
jgi:cell division protein FtsB